MSEIMRYDFCPQPNQQIDITVHLGRERLCSVSGVVLSNENQPVKNAVVKLYLKSKDCDGDKASQIACVFTCDNGRFLIGPVLPGMSYFLEVFKNDACTTDDVCSSPNCRIEKLIEE